MTTPRINQPVRLIVDHATQVATLESRPDAGDYRLYTDAARTQQLPIWNNPATLNTATHEIWTQMDLSAGLHHAGVSSYWLLDAGAEDALPLARNGTLVNGPSQVAGQVGNAYSFNGSTQYIDLPTAVSGDFDGKTAATFECWFILDATGASRTLFASQNNSGWSKFQVQYNSSGSIFVRARSSIGDAANGVNTTAAFTDTGIWHHLAAAINIATGTGKIWIDGVPQAVTGTPTYANHSFLAGAGPAAIAQNTFSSEYFNGTLDNVALYFRELTDDEVMSSYLRGSRGKPLTEPAPIASWTFNSSDNAGSEVVDIIGGHNGTFTGNVVTSQPGRVGQAIEIDGVSGNVEIPDSPDFEPHIGANGVSTWAATITLRSHTGFKTILAKDRQAELFNREFQLTVFNGYLELQAFDGTANNFIVEASSVPVPLNKPVHIAVVYDSVSQPGFEIRIYQDGVRVPSYTRVAIGGFTDFASSTPEIVTIGSASGATPTLFFDGFIDDVLWVGDIVTDANVADLAERSRQGLKPNFDAAYLANTVAYWSLDNQDIGREPLDVVGSANNLSVVNDTDGEYIQAGKEGQVGQSFLFSRNTQATSSLEPHLRNSAPVGMNPGAGSLSISAWIKTSFSGSLQFIFSRYALEDPPNTTDLVWLYVDNAADQGTFYVSDASANTALVQTAGAVNDGTWHNLVGVLDRSSNMAYIYLDGQLSGSVSAASVGSIALPSNVRLTVGNYYNTGAGGFGFEGNISNIEYFDEALSADEVGQLYRKGLNGLSYPASANPLFVRHGLLTRTPVDDAAAVFGLAPITGAGAAWDFDEEDGGTVSDVSTCGCDLTPVGEVKVVTMNHGLGRNTAAGVLDAAGTVIGTGDWAWHGSVQTTESDCVLAANYDGDPDNAGISFEVVGGKFAVRHSLGTGGGGETLVTGTTDVNDGALHQLLATIEDDTDINVYVDSNASEANSAPAGASVAPSANFRVGGAREVSLSAPSGLILHLEAENIDVGSDLDADGRVQTWEDLSASSNDASQATAASRPVYMPASGTRSGRPGVLFPEPAHMTLGTDIDLDDFTIFAVVEPWVDYAPGGNQRGLLTAPTTAGTPRGDIWFGESTGGITDESLSMLQTGGGAGVQNLTFPSGAGVLTTLSLSGTTESIYVNGQSQAVTEDSGGGLSSPSALTNLQTVGGRNDGNSLDGILHALMVFDSALSTADRERVERYLRLKYGLYGARANASFDTVRVLSGTLSAAQIAALTDGGNYPMVSQTNVIPRARAGGKEPVTIILP